MKTKLKHYLKELLFFALILFVTLNIINYFKTTNLNKSNLKQTSFTLLDGTTYTVDKTKPLLIHFWASWCPICKLEASNIEQLSKKYNVLTIAVNEQSKETILQYMKQNKLSFNVVNDANQELANYFHISVYPTSLIYNKNTQLQFTEVGYSSTLGLEARILLSSF